MKFTANKGQIIFAGRAGLIERKTPSMTVVRLATRKKDETEWFGIAFCNPKEDGKGQKLADLAENYIKKGSYITVVANEVKKGERTNYYAVAVELGPSPYTQNSQSKKEEVLPEPLEDDSDFEDDLPF